MKVAELIEILEDMDPDAEVLLGSQENWPFEYDVAGVTTRQEVEDASDDEEDAPRADGRALNDVFIVEGTQLRYGSNRMWQAARR